jgi:hypothetical protein
VALPAVVPGGDEARRGTMKLYTAKSGYGNEDEVGKGFIGSQHGERKHLRLNHPSFFILLVVTVVSGRNEKSEKIMNYFVQYARRKK